VLAWVLAGALAGGAGCAPRLMPPGEAVTEPRLELRPVDHGLDQGPSAVGRFVADDGVALPMRAWLPQGRPVAVVLALHGFNDYGNAFAAPALAWARQGIVTYAYDQRGFGGAPFRGLWAGGERLVRDLAAIARLVRKRHGGVPLHLLGESMGGAIVMIGLTGAAGPRVEEADGAVLVAPAVWGYATMNPLQAGALWLAAHSVPWLTFSGDGLGIRASDNEAVLRSLGADPLVIKSTRVDTIYGVVGLMDTAFEAAARLGPPHISQRVLILYGENDEVIPSRPVRRMIERLPEATQNQRRVVFYDKGWHMLLRDTQGERVVEDIAVWIQDPGRPLPSEGARAGQAMAE